MLHCVAERRRVMSLHKSLRPARGFAKKRNVLKREERIKLLKAKGLWDETKSPLGLPKTKPEA